VPGLDRADKSEGIHRALTTPLQSGPPVRFSATPTSTTFCSARWSRKSQTESIPIHQVDRPRASVQRTEIWPACSKQQYVTLQGRAPAPS